MTATTTTSDPEELSIEQLRHVLACRIARELNTGPTWTDENARILNNADPATSSAFAELEPLADRLLRHAEQSRAIGVEDDLIGCSIAVELLGLGYSEQEVAKLIAEAGIDWRFRTRDERLIAAATDLLAMGWDSELVRDAFAQMEVS
jgi:hypothetical protein